MKLKKDLELIIGEREMSEAALRKRHQDAVNELTQQLENTNRNRTKFADTQLCSEKKQPLLFSCITLRKTNQFE